MAKQKPEVVNLSDAGKVNAAKESHNFFDDYVAAEVKEHRTAALSAIKGVVTKINTAEEALKKIQPKKTHTKGEDGKFIVTEIYDDSQMAQMKKAEETIAKGNAVLDAFSKSDGIDLKPLLKFSGDQSDKDKEKE